MTTFLVGGGGLVPFVAVLATAAASVLRKWIEETSRTRRLIKSIEGTAPPERSRIIRACGQLEHRPVAGSDRVDGDATVHPRRRPSPPDDTDAGRARS